jgi:hypothetical protein
MQRPEPGEVAPYYERYVRLVPDGAIIDVLRQEHSTTVSLLQGLPDEAADLRYADGKWNIREIVGHVIDTEQVFAYRALRIARGDQTPLPGFDQDAFVASAAFDRRNLQDLLESFSAQRAATIGLLGGLGESEWQKAGIASESSFSVRGIAYVIAGHEIHHRRVILERYLSDT